MLGGDERMKRMKRWRYEERKPVIVYLGSYAMLSRYGRNGTVANEQGRHVNS